MNDPLRERLASLKSAVTDADAAAISMTACERRDAIVWHAGDAQTYIGNAEICLQMRVNSRTAAKGIHRAVTLFINESERSLATASSILAGGSFARVDPRVRKRYRHDVFDRACSKIALEWARDERRSGRPNRHVPRRPRAPRFSRRRTSASRRGPPDPPRRCRRAPPRPAG